MKRLINISLKK